MGSSINKYGDPNRLADVMALIQVLALDEHAHRSEDGLQSELQGLPYSAKTWTEIATNHSEFFRVNKNKGKEHIISLVARHVLPKNEIGTRELSPDFTGKLIEAAISLHDREMSRKESWKWIVPVGIAILTSIVSIVVTILKSKC
jgi:hypothetical protein